MFHRASNKAMLKPQMNILADDKRKERFQGKHTIPVLLGLITFHYTVHYMVSKFFFFFLNVTKFYW